MPLTATSKVEDGFAILELAGALTLGPLLGQVRDMARSTLANGHLTGLIIDVAGVTVTDSSGLSELTILYSLAVKRNLPLRLVGASTSLRKMLEMTRIDELLPTAPSIDSAKSDLRHRV